MLIWGLHELLKSIICLFPGPEEMCHDFVIPSFLPQAAQGEI